MKYICENCRNEVTDSQKFCGNCGSKFKQISDVDYKDIVKAYKTKINEKYSGLIDKGEQHDNFVFLLNSDVQSLKLDYCDFNKCESNTFLFIKNKLKEGESYFYPVGGFMFMSKSFHPIEHWWVYNDRKNEHIDVTPISGTKPNCYAGIINFDINNIIMQSEDVYEVDFFKGGNVYSEYFK